MVQEEDARVSSHGDVFSGILPGYAFHRGRGDDLVQDQYRKSLRFRSSIIGARSLCP